MKQIRRGVFETNSSSSHSLAYSKKDRGYDYDLPVDESGVLTIPFGEFGFGPKILRTPIEKLSYYITDNFGNDYFFKGGKNLEDKIYKNNKINRLIKLIKSKCSNVNEVKFKPLKPSWDEDFALGYVDHESCGTSNSENSVEKLIFDNSVIIIIDNDNSQHFEDYLESWDGKRARKSIEKLFDKKGD